MTWSRIGDFYKDDLRKGAGYGDLMRQVAFRSMSNQALVRDVHVNLYRDHSITISLSTTIFSNASLSELASKIGCKIYTRSSSITLEIETKDLLEKLFDLFKDLNDKYQCYIFSDNLILEMRRIYQFVLDDKLTSPHLFRHVLENYVKPHRHDNPARRHSKALVGLLGHFQKFDARKFKKLLLEGESPLQHDTYGETPFYFAAYSHHPAWVFELLLIYDESGYGLFNYENGNIRESAFEIVTETRQTDKLAVINSYITHLKKPLGNGCEQLKIDSSRMNYEPKQIITHFHFENDRNITTHLKCVADLTHDEKESIFTTLFAKAFEIPGDSSLCKLSMSYEQDLSEKTKFIEIIRDKDKIIGFNLFKIIAATQKKLMVLVIDYALIHPAYRGYGLMSLYAFRLAYALKLLKQNYKIAVFFLSIHFNSFKMIKDFLFFPKFQPDYMEGLVKNILNIVYDGDYQYVKDLMTCYVREKLRLRGSSYKGSDDIQQKFYHEYLLGFDNKSIDDERAVPVLFYVDNENYAKLSQLSLTLGIHFFDHILNLTRIFRAFLADVTRRPVKMEKFYGPDDFCRIRNTFQFWFKDGVMVQQNEPIDENVLLQRSKL